MMLCLALCFACKTSDKTIKTDLSATGNVEKQVAINEQAEQETVKQETERWNEVRTNKLVSAAGQVEKQEVRAWQKRYGRQNQLAVLIRI